MKTLYDVLGVPRDADDEMIRAAFRKAAKSYHPDLNIGDPTAEQQFRQIVAAYEMLKSPHQRAAYDHYLKSCRRARARYFAVPPVAGLVSGVVVAVGVWLTASFLSGQAPPTGLAGANVSQSTSLHVAVTDDSSASRRGTSGRASDWAAAAPNRRFPDERPRQAAAGSLQLAAAHPDAQALLAREWEQVKASGDPMALWAFAAYNPGSPQSELARSKLIELIDAADDVFLLHLLRVGAADAVAERAQQRLDRLRAQGGAKEDRVAFRTPPGNSLEERAASFASAQISSWSSTNAINLTSRARLYADEVLYYGSLKSRQAVILDKRRLLKESPERVYAVQPGSITVECFANACKVSGLMDWHTRSAPRAAPERGTAQFEYGITFSRGTFSILSEDTSAVERHAQGNGR